MLKPLKVLLGDIIYNQREKSKEIYFIIRGRVRLFYNLNPSSEIMSDNFLIGFNQYVQGSYFGDSSIIVGHHDATAKPLVDSNILVLSKIDLYTMIEKHKKEMKKFIQLAKERKEYHQDLILRSLEKDREAFKQLQKTQHDDHIDANSPAQYVVKNLRAHIENHSKDNLASKRSSVVTSSGNTQFEERIYRMIAKSEVPASDSEDGLNVSGTSFVSFFSPLIITKSY